MVIAFCSQNCTDIQKEKKSSRDPEKKNQIRELFKLFLVGFSDLIITIQIGKK